MAEEKCLFQAHVVCLRNNLICQQGRKNNNINETRCRRAQTTHRFRLSSPNDSTRNCFAQSTTLSPRNSCASVSQKTSTRRACATCIPSRCRASARRRNRKVPVAAAVANDLNPPLLPVLYQQTPSILTATANAPTSLRYTPSPGPLAWKVRRSCSLGRTRASRCLPVVAARRFSPHENPCSGIGVASADTCTSPPALRSRPFPHRRRRKHTPARFGSACFKFPLPPPPPLQKSSAHLQRSATSKQSFSHYCSGCRCNRRNKINCYWSAKSFFLHAFFSPCAT
jgi:hypothetical protein